MSNYSGTLSRQSLLDDFASVSDPLLNLIHNEPPIVISKANPFGLFANEKAMATAAPLSARHKTMVVRSMVVHLTDERIMLEVWKAGKSFFG